MEWIFYIFNIVSMGVSICWLFMRANRDRKTYFFMICQFFIIIWSSAKLIQLETVTLHQFFISYCIGNFAICFTGSVWLIFSRLYIGRKLSAGNIVFPIISLMNYIIFLTNNSHHLYYTEFSQERVGKGIFFYENIAYTYICMFAGMINIFRKLLKEKNKHTGQTFLLIGTVLLPVIANITYVCKVFGDSVDITPLTFGFSSIMILISIYRYGFLNVNALAFEKVIESISDGVFIFNSKGIITYSNISAENMLSDTETIADIEKYEGLDNISERFCETDIFSDERHLHIKRYNYFGNDGDLITSAFIITDTERYYELIERTEELSLANERLAVERERNRIAQEVHDTAGHTLTMINSLSRLSEIELSAGRNENVMQYVHETSQIASEGISQLRKSINNLKQGTYFSSVTASVEELVAGIREIEAELCIQGEEGEKHSVFAPVIYRCCREAVTNCLRYAQAERIDIILKFLENSLEVYIIDNGKGCDEIKFGNGLCGIRERVARAGGTVRLSSAVGNGFSVAVKLPLKGVNV